MEAAAPPSLGGRRSGRRDVRGLPDDAGAHLAGTGAGRGRVRVLAVGGRPAVDVVADERRGVLQAGDPEVGHAGADEGGHAGEGTRRDAQNRRVLPLPRQTHGLLEEKRLERLKTCCHSMMLSPPCITFLTQIRLECRYRICSGSCPC